MALEDSVEIFDDLASQRAEHRDDDRGEPLQRTHCVCPERDPDGGNRCPPTKPNKAQPPGEQQKEAPSRVTAAPALRDLSRTLRASRGSLVLLPLWLFGL